VWKSGEDLTNQENNIELFIDRTAALYIGETRTRVLTYEEDRRVGKS